MDWIAAGAHLGAGVPPERLKPNLKIARDAALAALKLHNHPWNERLAGGWHPDLATDKEKEALLTLASMYLGLASTGRDGNPVAKFHMGNGAKLHLINWAGDLSRKGLRQSAGLMVNYLYDLGSVEDNHERFVNGEITYSRAVGRLMTA
jgi:malonyl-CoA decarboxylase